MRTTITVFLAAFVLTAVGGMAASGDHSHMWTKIEERRTAEGRVICTWECPMVSPNHFTTTSGYGYCSHPQ